MSQTQERIVRIQKRRRPTDIGEVDVAARRDHRALSDAAGSLLDRIDELSDTNCDSAEEFDPEWGMKP